MRLFVAVWPPSDVLEAVAALDRPTLPEVRWTSPDQWHVTVRFLGSVPDEQLGAVIEAVDTVELAGGAPLVTMGPETSCFGGGRVLHIPASGLAALAAATVRATAGFGEPPDPRPFAGHLTLARSRSRRGPGLRPLAGVPLAASWPATELTLVRSHLNRAGARYEVVHRRPLTAG